MFHHTDNPIDLLFALPDEEMIKAVKAAEVPDWVHEYVDFVLSGGHPMESRRTTYH